MPQAQIDDMVGRLILGRYRIVRLLARGGMGSIYLARNKGAAGFVRPAVVKKILPSYLGDESAVQMFAREARIMSNLRHPGIVNIIDFSEEDGAYVMVLEYVHGTHTGRWLRFLRKVKNPFPVELALQIMILTLDALDYAHTATALDGTPLGVIHRDIKPSNILVDVAGHVKLADFGIARAPNDKTEVSSGTTKLKGTFPYLAPEIFDDAEPSPATDVYACGVVLHTLLTGRNEFSAKEVSTTIMRVLEHVPTPLLKARSDVSQALSAVVARSLSKDPTYRYQSAAEFAAVLRNARELSEADANELLRTSAGRDFRDGRFAQLLGIDDLATLERALTQDGDDIELTAEIHLGAEMTEPSIGGFTQTPTSATVPSAPKTAAGAASADAIGLNQDDELGEPEATRARRAHTSPQSTQSVEALPPPRRSWPIVIGLIVAAGIIGGGIVVAGYMFKQNQSTIVVGGAANGQEIPVVPGNEGTVARGTEGSAGNAETGDGETAVGEAGEGETVEGETVEGETGEGDPAPDRNPTGTPTKPPPKRKQFDMQLAIDTTMHQRSSQFQSCFEQHPELAKTLKKVDLEMRVRADGGVSSSRVITARVSGHALGGCLNKVARATRFKKLPKAIGFKFPLYPKVR